VVHDKIEFARKQAQKKGGDVHLNLTSMDAMPRDATITGNFLLALRTAKAQRLNILF
jgi:hypothetical protein